MVRCRLDWALTNENWHDVFSYSDVEYLSMIGSDHRPIIATIEDKITRGRKQFWFDKRWIECEGLINTISTERLFRDGGKIMFYMQGQN